jgi:hypothetical protein
MESIGYRVIAGLNLCMTLYRLSVFIAQWIYLGLKIFKIHWSFMDLVYIVLNMYISVMSLKIID